MICRPIRVGGMLGFACTRGSERRRLCGVCRRRTATALCDGRSGTSATCDRPLCARCAVHSADDTDYCPSCARRQGAQPQQIDLALPKPVG